MARDLEGQKEFCSPQKYFKIYVRDFDGASELRARLMDTKSILEFREI